MKKFYLLSFVACLATSSLAQDAETFELGKPGDNNYRYLDDYKALKDYVDRTQYPNFKLGIGTTVSEYLKKSTVYNLTNKNFNETVAGNAMKMSGQRLPVAHLDQLPSGLYIVNGKKLVTK